MSDHKLKTRDPAATEPQQLSVAAARPTKGSVTEHTVSTPGGPVSFRATADWVGKK